MSLIELDLRTARPRQVILSNRSKSTSSLIFEPSYSYQLLPAAWAAVCRDPSHSRKWEADEAYIEGQGVPAYALAACDALQHTLAEHPEEPTREFDLTWDELMAPADAEPPPLLAPHVPWPRRAAEALAQAGRDFWHSLSGVWTPSRW